MKKSASLRAQQWTHSAHPEHTQCTPSAHPQHTQCTPSAHPEHTQCTPRAHPAVACPALPAAGRLFRRASSRHLERDAFVQALTKHAADELEEAQVVRVGELGGGRGAELLLWGVHEEAWLGLGLGLGLGLALTRTLTLTPRRTAAP